MVSVWSGWTVHGATYAHILEPHPINVIEAMGIAEGTVVKST
jgi:hypothetical protein